MKHSSCSLAARPLWRSARAIRHAAGAGLLLLTAVFGGAVPASAVIGGDPVPDGTYPFVAAILDKTLGTTDYSRQYCTGSLVDPGWVLTAAHCVDWAGPGDVAVTVGRTVLSSTAGERFNVVEIVRHADWKSSSLDHDVALLRLDGTSRVQPIQLPLPRDREFEAPGHVLSLAGWGDTDPAPGHTRPDRLRVVPLPVFADADCVGGKYGDSLWLCAGGVPEMDGCNGDSGGPLFAKRHDGTFLQMGSTSFGSYPCGTGHPGGYVDLNYPQIRNFLHQTMRTPLDPCGDGLTTPHWFGWGKAVERDGEMVRVNTASGKVCPGARVDRFVTALDSYPSQGDHQYAEARLTFDPDQGGAELRLLSCGEVDCRHPLVPDASTSGPGFQKIRWRNTTGEPVYVAIDVALLGGGQLPLPYQLETVVNVVEPPPPPPPTPPCDGLPMPGQWWFESSGETTLVGTLCDEVPFEYFDGEVEHNSVVRAELRVHGTETLELKLATCDGLCEQLGSVESDEAGIASHTWTNCRGTTRNVLVGAVAPSITTPVTYELVITVTPGAGGCA